MNSTQNAKIQQQILEQAVSWMLKQQHSPFNFEEQQQFERWKNQSKQHQRAWHCVEYLNQNLNTLPAQDTENILNKAKKIHHSQRISKFIIVFFAVFAAYLGWQSNLHYALTSDYVTAKGEQQSIQLKDGTQVHVNTQTAFDTHFDQKVRLIQLHYGEIQIKTAPDKATIKRPFRVQTKHGTLEALGTVFNVKQINNETCLSVIEKAVELKASSVGEAIVIHAPNRICFNERERQSLQPIDMNAQAWKKQLLFAYNMPLSDFLQEFQRYHTAYIHLDKKIQDLPVSGSYPVNDTEQMLALLSRTYSLDFQTHLKGYVINVKAK